MNWISKLFSTGKEKDQINRNDQEKLNQLVMIAALENRLEPSDINLLTEQVNFIRYEELTDKHRQIMAYRSKLPGSPTEKFRLIFLLVTVLMRNGALSEKKERMLTRIAQVLLINKQRSQELISFIISNIRNGLGMEDSYMRLGYLLEKRKYA